LKSSNFAFAVWLAIGMSASAVAQTTFSFSGLQWGENVDQVNAKLRTAGFSGCALIERIKCKLASECMCNFNGPSIRNGWATFKDNKLDQVSVNVADLAGTTSALRSKYGPPLPKLPVKSQDTLAEIEEVLTSRWKSQYGETLQIGHTGHVEYRSGEKVRAQEDRVKRESSVF